MSRLQALREQKQKQAAALRTLADKLTADGYTPTDADDAAWKAADAEYNETARQVALLERAEIVEAGAARTNDRPPVFLPTDGRERGGSNPDRSTSDSHRALAIQAWFRGNCSDPSRFPLSAEHREACERVGLDVGGFGRNGNELVIRLRPTADVAGMQSVFASSPPAFAKANALAALNGHRVGATQYGAALSGQNASTGATIMAPETMVNTIEVNMLAHGGILQAAEIMRTEGRERMRWPTVNDTSNSGRRLGENAAVTSTAQPSFGAIYWDCYKYTSDEILVPYELLVGTPYNLPSVLGAMMGERIGRKASTDLTTGTGSNQPKGLVTAATSFSAAGATSITWDDLDNLIAAVDPAYRAGASFMFHDATRNYLKKLKDGNGRPLWADSPNGTEPALLKGYPWFVNQAMDSTISSGKKTVTFGQHTKYKVRQVDAIRVYRLVERHRENDQDAFLAFAEMDGNLVDAGTAPVKYLAH